MNKELTLQLACSLMSIILVFIFVYVLLEIPLPVQKVYPVDLLELESAEPILRSYIWVYRSYDLVVQALLLFVTALAILLIFKAERW
ncbi:MAG: hypothetical protein ABDH32_03460 [Candidatus Caldarchaeales archaeon]